MSQINIPVSPGELIDKLTILEIKSQRIRDRAKLANVVKELELLTRTWLASGHAAALIEDQRAALKAVNEGLWEIEDAIRRKESHGEFDGEFIELARAVYINNDRRAALKREINQRLGSEIVEEKSYADYRRDGESGAQGS
jgi:hypothetical protein